MAKLMIVGWSGKFPDSARFISVRGNVTKESLRTTDVYYDVMHEAYGNAGAIWNISGDRPILLGTWYRDSYGNFTLRNKTQYGR